jgi:hypothetical protein
MNKEPSVLLLEHHLKVLKLPTFLRDYAGVGAVCDQERADYPTYLLRLAERELIDRERRATERRIKEAAFPVLKTIETFAFAAQPSINEPLVRELLRGEYIGKRENILLVGNPGTGKTHLASALGFAACTQGKRVRFTTTTGLVTGTVFGESKLPLRKWFMAIYLLSTTSKGISSVQLAKHVGVTQKTAWFMAHRIREAHQQNKGQLFGKIEADETFIGGLSKNMHKAKREAAIKGIGGAGKTRCSE